MVSTKKITENEDYYYYPPYQPGLQRNLDFFQVQRGTQKFSIGGVSKSQGTIIFSSDGNKSFCSVTENCVCMCVCVCVITEWNSR